MPVPAVSAAKKICEESDWTLSNLELQKLLYIAHMYHLGLDNSPLVNEYFEAWDYGPVVPELYHKVKSFGKKPVQNVFYTIPNIPTGTLAEELLVDVVRDLGDLTSGQLVAAVHWREGAWARYYEPNIRGNIIPNEAIRAEYDRRQERQSR